MNTSEVKQAIELIQKHCKRRNRAVEFYADGNMGERGGPGSTSGHGHTSETLAAAITQGWAQECHATLVQALCYQRDHLTDLDLSGGALVALKASQVALEEVGIT